MVGTAHLPAFVTKPNVKVVGTSLRVSDRLGVQELLEAIVRWRWVTLKEVSE